MVDLFNNMFRRVMVKYVPLHWLVSIEAHHLKLIPDDLKTQKMCNGAIEKAPWLIHYVPAHLMTWEMCSRPVERCLHHLRFILSHLKTEEMCKEKVRRDPWSLYDVPDYFKIQSV